MEHQYGGNNSSNLPATSSYSSSMPSVAPQQLQQSATMQTHTTLPPLPQHAAINSMNSLYNQQPMGSAPHTPTSTQPNTPGSTGNGGFQQQMGGQPPQRTYHMPHNPSYQHPLPQYTPNGMMPQSSGSMSHPHGPQAIAPAPGPGPRGLVPIRPMNSSAPMHSQHHMHPQMHNGMTPFGHGPPQDDVPTHVVGSQGRRGILPSAPGRPAVTATGPGASKNAMIPAKDADGKFPCPHCVKTYLHAKHLKRHLLRHTGDRPYMCVLCRDTFSRSDILKRHFQKCSIRRGNPTGASHLSHAQAHLKKNQPAHKHQAPPQEGDMMRNMNGGPTDPNLHQFGMMDGRGPPNMNDDQMSQQHLSRANSIKRMGSNDGHDRRSMTGPTPSGSSSRQSFDQNYNGDIPSTMSSLNPQLAAYNMPNGHNGPAYGQHYDYQNQSNGSAMHPAGNEEMGSMTNGRGPMPVYGAPSNGPQSNLDWAHMFHTGAQESFMSPYNSSLVQNQMAIKAEPSSIPPSNDNLYANANGMYPGGVPGPNQANGNANAGNFPAWNLTSQQNPYNPISSQLINFCCPPGSHAIQTNGIRMCLSPENIKHFLEQYTNFQGHFPIIHMPTFNIEDAYHGLLLAMVCIGAVYSDRIRPAQVRDLMEHTKSAIDRDSRVLSTVIQQDRDTKPAEETIGASKSELEEVQAILLLQILFTFHGTPVQREMARRNYPVLRKISNLMSLNKPSTTTSGTFSLLHQPNVKIEHCNAASFDWNSWVEQEKRSRLFYVMYLLDAAMVIYFNNAPSFDAFDVSLPLPADDAAWDAWTSTLCAEALGLHGQVVAKEKNVDGSRRPKQPEMNDALKALMDNNNNLKPGSTNVFSKFILIHALLVQLWCYQKQMSQDNERNAAQGAPSPAPSHDEQRIKVESGSQPASGRQTPDAQTQQYLMVLGSALDKWKRTWDDDMQSQYPPSGTSYRRFGFCRDAIHFYYLGKYLMKKTGMDFREAPDKRFTLVIHLLKSVKTWVVSDSAKRNEELGSVGDIEQSYGVSDLTLDMAQFFKPINRQIDSPVAGVHTNIGGGNTIMG